MQWIGYLIPLMPLLLLLGPGVCLWLLYEFAAAAAKRFGGMPTGFVGPNDNLSDGESVAYRETLDQYRSGLLPALGYFIASWAVLCAAGWILIAASMPSFDYSLLVHGLYMDPLPVFYYLLLFAEIALVLVGLGVLSAAFCRFFSSRGMGLRNALGSASGLSLAIVCALALLFFIPLRDFSGYRVYSVAVRFKPSPTSVGGMIDHWKEVHQTKALLWVFVLTTISAAFISLHLKLARSKSAENSNPTPSSR